MIFKLVIAFLLIYFVLFVVETIKLSRNSRPKMQDNCEIKFKDVKKVKTQNIYYIEGR
mgnify:CR=1 FL=1